MRKINHWIADLSIGWKFRIVAFGFLLPVIILSFLLISEQNVAIDFSRAEIQGTDFLQPVFKLYYHLVQFAATPANTPVFYKHRAQIDSTFRTITLADRGYYNSRARLQKLKNLWHDNNEFSLAQIIGEMPELMRLIANESKLILDPDLESYYLMDITVLKIPEHLLILYRFASLYPKHGSSDSFPLLLELLRSQNDKIKESSKSVVQYLSNEDIINEFTANSSDFLAQAENFTNANLTGNKIPYAEYLEMLETNSTLWHQSAALLRLILQNRNQSLVMKKYSTSAYISIIILLTAFIFIIIARHLSSSVRALNSAASEVTSGNLKASAEITSSDEFGRFALTFNKMIRELSLYIKNGSEQLQITKVALDKEIRQHKEVEEALSKSEILFRQVWEISVTGMRLTDQHGKIVAVNDSFCQTVRMERSALIGQPFSIIYHANEREPAMQMYEHDLSNNALKTHFELERTLWNGQKVWFDFSNSFLEISGTGKIVLSVINDITKRKHAEFKLVRSEKRFKMLFNNANDVVFVNHFSSEFRFGNLIEVNDFACLRLGYRREELLNMDPSKIISPKYSDIYEHAQNDIKNKKHAIFEVEILCKDKRRIPVEISSQVFDYDEIPTVLSIARDITKRKQVEYKLKHTSEQLRNLASRLQTIREEERTMIAREIHDELGQVLTVLKIQISLLANKLHLNQKSERKRIESVLREIDRTVETVQRITAKLRPGILDELGLVPAIEWQSQEFEQQTGIQVDYTLPKKDILLEEEKSTAIFRIFQEALTNIARHAQAKKVSVILKQENNHLLLEITDNGQGILKSQIEDANSLGLLGMKERAHILGGKVLINGVPGQGTNVKVEMPQG